MTVVTANPGTPLAPPSASPQRHLLLGHKASVTLKTLLTQNSAVAATVKTKTPLQSVPAVARPTCRGGMWPSQWGSCVSRPGSKPAEPVLCQHPGCGAVPARLWGPGPTPPLLAAHTPRDLRTHGRMLHGLAGGLGAPLGKAAKLRTSSKHRVNTSFQREVVARGQTPYAKLCSLETQP